MMRPRSSSGGAIQVPQLQLQLTLQLRLVEIIRRLAIWRRHINFARLTLWRVVSAVLGAVCE